MSAGGGESGGGPIRWMAHNSVAANLLMGLLVIGGLRMAKEVRQEVFPDLDIDMVAVAIAYPGASPAEVESGVVLLWRRPSVASMGSSGSARRRKRTWGPSGSSSSAARSATRRWPT